MSSDTTLYVKFVKNVNIIVWPAEGLGVDKLRRVQPSFFESLVYRVKTPQTFPMLLEIALFVPQKLQ